MSGSAPFEISVDENRGIIHSVLRGFWTLDLFETFEREMKSTSSKLRRTHPVFALFSDCTDFPVQSPEVVILFKRIEGPEVAGGPSAILVSSALVKLQAERILPHPLIRMFTDRAEAESWLRSTLDASRRAA